MLAPLPDPLGKEEQGPVMSGGSAGLVAVLPFLPDPRT